MKPSSGYGQTHGFLDIKTPVKKVENPKKETTFDIGGPLLHAQAAVSTSTSTISLPAHHIRLKLPHIKTRLMIICLLAASLLATGVIFRNLLINSISPYYSDIYDKIALKVNPLPPLAANDIRIKSKYVTSVTKSIDNQLVSIKVGGTALHPTSKVLQSWYKLSSSHYGVTTIYPERTAINNYLNQAIDKLKVAPVNKVVTTLSADNYTTTISSGSNGVTFPSSNNISNQIDNRLLSGKGMNLNLPSIAVPYSVTKNSNIPKLLEVDVTTKRMYAYQNGSLIQTFLVTAGAPATPTPLGVFHIWEKLPIQTMTGYNPNGTKYVQPNVQWINYFDHSGDAVHGNYWRPLSYFGNVNSSHGCVGLIDSQAQWVYNWAPIGTPVVIHS